MPTEAAWHKPIAGAVVGPDLYVAICRHVATMSLNVFLEKSNPIITRSVGPTTLVMDTGHS